ncbi:solute carrier family 52, riboflavin transporter, member 3-A isoform X2 [Chrysoperla carnea]|nr:solute carrier family 52, riboflavin transporter, member 3-A isoform X2 [Chrysoperla carnea]XP_044740854.1 solute carrier family 52, riboflavin transporter, member 3-A isoform X2 [Chrysoperla carnea]XP_044740855.1 solute carrier family 52, riboflavin transporter, member 3-A isoform X2 [Chrysoperla carnea]
MAAGQFLKQLNERKLVVDLFTVFFGVSAWIGVNTLFNELPLLVESSPEQWNLPSYLTVIVQIANIGPISYSILKKYFSVSDKYTIYLIITIGALSALSMAFFYSQTTMIFGVEHSTALFVLMFFTALVGCTSSVLFMPYMGRYLEIYLITYLMGEGLSGFIASMVAIVQGVGSTECVNKTDPDGGVHLEPKTYPAHFSTKLYFLIEFGILLLSLISFYLLNNLSVSKSQMVKNYSPNMSENIEESQPMQDYVPLSKPKFYSLCLYMATINFFGNGVFPSIQSYSVLPYGPSTYHFTICLSNMANPIACFLAYFLPKTTFSALASLTVLTFGTGVYIFSMAVLSPTPLLVDSIYGSIIIVVLSILFVAFVSYIKLSVTMIFRNELSKAGQNSALFWCGAYSQIGSALGAVVMFIIINVGKVFEQYQACS